MQNIAKIASTYLSNRPKKYFSLPESLDGACLYKHHPKSPYKPKCCAESPKTDRAEDSHIILSGLQQYSKIVRCSK